MVYDPVNRQIVLFGGDQLDRLLADTWVFDCESQRWQEKRPALGPSPRGGHALVYLPKSERILLFGGYTYTSDTDYCAAQYKPLPFEMWAYDPRAHEWALVRRDEEAGTTPYQRAFYMSFTTHPAAADADAQAQRPITLLNVSYDPTREFYEEFNRVFIGAWARDHNGQRLTINQSHGGSGRQAR